MQKLVLIVGNGGAGKRTNGQLLYSKLPRASWTHMRWMTALQIWEPNAHFDDLLIRNAAAVIGNYLDEGVDPAILSGGIFTQAHLDRLLALLNRPLDVRYFWLHLPDDLRASRLINRARDSGDTPESVRELVAKYTSAQPELSIPVGSFNVIDVSKKDPVEIVENMIDLIR